MSFQQWLVGGVCQTKTRVGGAVGGGGILAALGLKTGTLHEEARLSKQLFGMSSVDLFELESTTDDFFWDRRRLELHSLQTSAGNGPFAGPLG